MKHRSLCWMVLGCVLLLAESLVAADAACWPTFRGPNNTGTAAAADPPVTWSETKNIKWKVEFPGSGLSSPVIWGDQLFFLTAVATETVPQPSQEEPPAEEDGGRRRRPRMRNVKPTCEYKFDVVCLDRKTGKTLWQTTVKQALPHEGHHGDASFASYSPVTDGKFVWASFGSQGLYCLDMKGAVQWSQDLVQQRIRAGFGEGSSPAIAGDAVIVVADHEDQSYIYAFHKLTGEPLWKKERDETTCWASPIAIEVNGRIQVVTNGSNFVRSYDAKTGDLIWHCSGQTQNAIPTPVAGFGKVYCTSGYRGAALYAIDPTKTGDLSDTDAVLWKVTQACPYVPSPALVRDKIYVCSGNNAEISCYQAEDGKANFIQQKVEALKGVYSSFVGAGDKVYLAGRNGVTAVLKVSDTFELLATNTLDDKIDATPAVVGNELYIKGVKYLYCIAEK